MGKKIIHITCGSTLNEEICRLLDGCASEGALDKRSKPTCDCTKCPVEKECVDLVDNFGVFIDSSLGREKGYTVKGFREEFNKIKQRKYPVAKVTDTSVLGSSVAGYSQG